MIDFLTKLTKGRKSLARQVLDDMTARSGITMTAQEYVDNTILLAKAKRLAKGEGFGDLEDEMTDVAMYHHQKDFIDSGRPDNENPFRSVRGFYWDEEIHMVEKWIDGD